MITFPRMHVSLYVSDLQQTITFYNTFFNQSPSKEKPKYVKYELEEPALIISFIESKDKVKANFGHLGFQVGTPMELNNRLERLKAANLVALEEVGTKCCYAVQDKFWVNDPDGHQWEIYFFHKDVDFNDPHYALSSSDELVENTVLEVANSNEVKVLAKQACC